LDSKNDNNSGLDDVTKIVKVVTNPNEILNWTIKFTTIHVWAMSQKSQR